MGTFHDDKCPLHGITVVVDTPGPRVYVGRCDDMDDREIVLMDADVHEERPGGPSKEAYLARAARVGVFKRHDRLVIPRSEARSVRRLSEMA